MKSQILIEEEKIKEIAKRINDIREPEDDWQSLLKALISQIMDDYIRLQHPLRRNQTYLKEAFCATIAALWDHDYTFAEFKNENNQDMTFREILAARFGLDKLDISEIHKINLGALQQELIKEAQEYWLDKGLSIVKVPDFFIFDGRAFSIWKTEDISSIDFENMIIYLEDINDDRELNETFIKISMEIAAYYRNIKINKETLNEFSKAWYEIMRFNSCFKESL